VVKGLDSTEMEAPAVTAEAQAHRLKAVEIDLEGQPMIPVTREATQ
jgi:hypothetical protein